MAAFRSNDLLIKRILFFVLVLLLLPSYVIALPAPLPDAEGGFEYDPEALPTPQERAEEHIKVVHQPSSLLPFDPGNCWSYVKYRYPDLPCMDCIQPNTELAVGAVAIMYYGSVKHVAVVEAIEEGGFWISECNYDDGECGVRFIDKNYSRLRGFYTP